jgi:hypothetical protein
MATPAASALIPHERAHDELLRTYAHQAGFPSPLAAMEFLRGIFNLDLVPVSRLSIHGGPVSAGISLIKVTPCRLAITVCGALTEWLDTLPAWTLLLPGFFSPESARFGWESAVPDWGSFYGLLDAEGHRTGVAQLIEPPSGGPRWVLGGSLPELSVKKLAALAT